MKFIGKIQNNYEQLWKYVIRPNRTIYSQNDLGPPVLKIDGKQVRRKDFQLTNDRNYDFSCSLWIPADIPSYSCVIYLHGNSSNRIEGIEYLDKLIGNNIALCTFDFSGCGNAQGQYISLGYHQQRDLQLVIDYLKMYPQIKNIGIWGRSMGAVTGLLYLAKSDQIKAAVFDSPFKSFKGLVEDMAQKTTKIPNMILNGMLKFISKTIKQKADFSIYDLNPLKLAAPQIFVPGFFIVGIDDQIIPLQHTKLLFEEYASQDKVIKMVKGQHNDNRPDYCVNQAIKFLTLKFQQENSIHKNKIRLRNQQKINKNMNKEQKQADFTQEQAKNVEEQLKKGEFSWSGIFSMSTKHQKRMIIQNNEVPIVDKKLVPTKQLSQPQAKRKKDKTKKKSNLKSLKTQDINNEQEDEKRLEQTYKNYNYCYI